MTYIQNTDPMTSAAAFVAGEVERFPREVRSLPVSPNVTPAEIRAHLAEQFSFVEPKPLEAIVADVADMMRRWTLHATHPRYFGLFNADVHEAGVWGDALAALYNPQVGGWWHAPAACEIERHTLHFFARAMGWDVGGMTAHFTTGGSEANQTAVLAAIASRHGDALREGLTKSGARPAVYVSRESHHSFHKIARMSGLGDDAVRVIDVDSRWRMDVAALSLQIAADRAAGWQPMMLVGTAGTTAGGAIDPLPELAALARREGLWFHVDAAWGGSALMSPSLGFHLGGIELADSVTWDAHKWLSAPMGAGMFFCKHREPLKRMFDVETGYVPHGVEGEDDLYRMSIQWSRRYIGLKVFCTVAALGVDRLRRMIEHQAAMGDLLRAKLVERGWIMVNDSVLPVVCFTHPRVGEGSCSAAALVGRVCTGGRAWISEVRLTGKAPALRACITNYRSTEGDLAVLMEELQRALDAECMPR
jgi:glutamate/tyrosine decarboxylase-like PLP-dependent enzyme